MAVMLMPMSAYRNNNPVGQNAHNDPLDVVVDTLCAAYLQKFL